MSQVTVLMPNARRVVVKTNLNMTILEIIETACQKQELNPNKYDIKHHKKTLDVTSTFRFSAIPNNAVLELVEAKQSRTESNVTICLQLDNNERLIADFQPVNTLYDIVDKLAPQNLIDSNPVIIYMRREIIGMEELKKTSLRTIGLTGGSAVLRLLNKTVEELKNQANVSAPLMRQKITEDREGSSDLKKKNQKTDEDLESEKKIGDYHKQKNKVPEENEENTNKVASLQKNDSDIVKASEKTVTHKSDVIDSETASSKNEMESKKPEIPVFTGKGYKLGTSLPETNYKPLKTSEAAWKGPPRDKIHWIGERNAVIYNLQDIPPSADEEDLPDDFFELTINDARILLSTAKEEISQLQDAPLQTSAQRSFEEDKRILSVLNSSKHTVIRVKLPDRTVLQAVFSPVETVGDVAEFTKQYLKDPNVQFSLYTTPPKRILPNESRLIDVDCVPSALLYFQINVGSFDGSFLLKDELLEKFSCPAAANTNAAELRLNDKRNIQARRKHDNEGNLDQQPSVSGIPSTSSKKESDTEHPPQKVPKWFKITK